MGFRGFCPLTNITTINLPVIPAIPAGMTGRFIVAIFINDKKPHIEPLIFLAFSDLCITMSVPVWGLASIKN